MWNKIIGVIGAIFVLIKVIPELIELFETPGFGKEKKDAVLEVLELVLTEVKKAAGLSFDLAWVMGLAGKLIDIIVAVYNAFGFFTHRSTTESP